jgi:hypothetical protein
MSPSPKMQAIFFPKRSKQTDTGFMLVSCLAYSILKMGAACSSETSVDLQQTTRRCISEDGT